MSTVGGMIIVVRHLPPLTATILLVSTLVMVAVVGMRAQGQDTVDPLPVMFLAIHLLLAIVLVTMVEVMVVKGLSKVIASR